MLVWMQTSLDARGGVDEGRRLWIAGGVGEEAAAVGVGEEDVGVEDGGGFPLLQRLNDRVQA